MVVQLARGVVAVARSTSSARISVSIIIPVFNEASHLKQNLQRLYASFNGMPLVEVIICDGGSTDNSVLIAQQFPCQITTSKPGRAQQMNTASELACGDWLLFLHADSQLPARWLEQLDNNYQWGFFPVKLSGEHRLLRIIETTINLRSRFSRVATGDQALFFQRPFFSLLQGFPLIPIMEDIAMSKKARRIDKPRVALNPVVTSSRRWEKNGIVKTITLMWGLRLAYWLGVNPIRLHQIYYPKQNS